MGKEQSSYTALNNNDMFPSLESKSLRSRHYNGHKCMLQIISINSIHFLLKLLQQKILELLIEVNAENPSAYS